MDRNGMALPKHANYSGIMPVHGEGTPLSICRKGSYTLEAAIILPFAAGFLVSLLFFFRVLQIETAVNSALTYAARKTAAQVTLCKGEMAQRAAAEVFFREELSGKEEICRYVQGGSKGISLLASDFSGDYVALRAKYYVRLPISFFGYQGMAVEQNSKSKKWVGETPEGEPAEIWVYVTPYGEVYHTDSLCHYLDLSISEVTVREVMWRRNYSGKRYETCLSCDDKALGETVYITNYGEAYHRVLSCPGLKRTIEKIPLSEVGDKRQCGKCRAKRGKE